MQKAVQIIYKGRVQGVGFRYTATDLAIKKNIFGFVQNLPNGDVEVVAQGEEAHVDEFVDGINQVMDRYISDTVINIMDVSGQYKDFRIKY